MNQKPNITVSSRDADRLEKLLDAMDSSSPNHDALMDELTRAHIVSPEDMPPNIVTMNSTVKFKDINSDKEFSLTLIYPHGDASQGDTVSILAPVGSALLGLTEGNTIEWPKPGGGFLSVEIIEVMYQPEREGLYYR